MRVLGLVLAFAAAAPAAHAKAPKPPPPFQKCSLPQGAKFHKYFRGLPASIRRDFVKHRGAIAEQGEAYGGDVFLYERGADGVEHEVDPRPKQRFVGAVVSEGAWVIWCELWRGQLLVSAYRLVYNAASASLVYLGEASADQPCAVTDAFMPFAMSFQDSSP